MVDSGPAMAETVTIPIQLMTELDMDETPADARHRIYSLIHSHISPISLTLDVLSNESSNKRKEDEYESSKLLRLHGHVQVHGSSGRTFVQQFVSMGQKSLYLSVNSISPDQDAVVFDPLCLRESIKDDNRITKIADFHLGSRVSFTDFVCHFAAKAAENSNFRLENLTATFDHDMGKFHINFFNRDMQSRVLNVGTNYEIRIKYESVSAVILVPMTGERDFLRAYFILKYPPSLYEMVITEYDALEKISQSFGRATTFPVPFEDGGIAKEDFGRCNVLAIDFHLIGKDSRMREIRSSYHRPAVIDPWLLMSNFKRFNDHMHPLPFYFASMQVHDGRRFCESLKPELLQEQFFPIFYATKCCCSISHQFVDDLSLNGNWEEFSDFVLKNSSDNIVVLEKALFDVFRIMERNTCISVMSALPEIFSHLLESNYTDYTCVRGIRKIRRAVLTLTHVILLPPHPFVESRFMRICEPGYALRCHIRDDDNNLLTNTLGYAAADRQRVFLMKHIRDAVMDGIQIGYRTYHFLGSSSSQIRDHGLLLYAKDSKGCDAKHYRTSIGDFSGIRCVGKYIARVGQAFSQMLESVMIDSSVMPQKIPDIKGGWHPQSGNPYCFTDGVGVVSTKLAKKFAERLGIPDVPSAYQIRYKGCKGLVVVDAEIDMDIEFLGYRESMDKFPCDSDTLEILKYSCPRPVFLNRPLITLLSQLGTPLNTFERLLADHLTKLIRAFLNEDSAIECIRSYCPQIFNLMKFDLIHQSGLSILSEPFFRKVLDIVIRKKIRELKKKARIQIPFDEGRIMFGVADEHQTLAYGQVFVQYTHSSGARKVLTGEVMVTKNPCMHPGDVRKFTAVDVPQLRHIVDCIVFPTTGPRPHPNEMAGSDLDGDEYSVIWMKKLYFQKPNQPAMIFSDEKAEELRRPVEVRDIMTFFCDFIRTNVVGLIANAHLAIADTQSIFHPKCLDLCEKYSQALDFAKTGRNTELPPEDRPTHYPDFMEKGAERSTYRSHQPLGTLFRWIDLFEKAINDSTREVDPSHIPNPLLQCNGWEEFEEVALKDFEKYKMTCECLLKELSIESEESLLSSICERTGKYAIGKREDMQEMLERIVKDTFEGFRYRFEENTHSESDRQKKAVAYYMIARVKQDSMSGKKWYGFPWIASQELASILQGNEVEKNVQELTIAALIDSILSPDSGKDAYTRAKNYLCDWTQTNPLRKVRLQFDTAEELALIDQTLIAVRYKLPIAGDDVRPTAGEIIVSCLKQLVMDMMKALKKNTGVKSTLKLGIAAMISLNQCFRTGKIDCLTSPNACPSESMMNSNDLKLNRFHISLSIPSAQKFTQLVECHHDKVLKFLQLHSNVKSISARMVSQYNYRYWLVSALGDEWSLANLSNLLVQQDFYTRTTGEIQNLIHQNNNTISCNSNGKN